MSDKQYNSTASNLQDKTNLYRKITIYIVLEVHVHNSSGTKYIIGSLLPRIHCLHYDHHNISGCDEM